MNEDSTASQVQACINKLYCVMEECHDQETCQSNVDKIYEEFIGILKLEIDNQIPKVQIRTL